MSAKDGLMESPLTQNLKPFTYEEIENERECTANQP
jgi:hypothetical protein